MRLWQRRTLGILALGGGFVGVALGSQMLMNAELSVPARVLILPFMALYGFGVWCGLGMLESRPGTVALNRLFWLLQVPYVMSPIAGYLFASGAMAYVSFAPGSGFGAMARFGSQFQYSLFELTKPFVIGVNVVALAVFAFLTWELRRERKEQASAEILAGRTSCHEQPHGSSAGHADASTTTVSPIATRPGATVEP